MIPADETFDGTFPFEPHFTDAPGFRMHYVDEGEGEPIVMLHGEPTWGYLYRNFIPELSKTHRVIVPECPTTWASARAKHRRTASTR